MQELAEIAGAVVEWCAQSGPRPVRIGCALVLGTIVAGLLGLAIWAQFK